MRVKKSAIQAVAPDAKDFTQKKGSRYRTLADKERSENRFKSKTRARVEHLFGIMEGRFGFTKVRYKGLAKNAHHLFVSSALTNLVVARDYLLKQSGPLQA